MRYSCRQFHEIRRNFQTCGAGGMRDKRVGKALKAPRIACPHGMPIARHISFAEEVAHVVLPLLPIFRFQQLVAHVMLVDFLVERERKIADVVQFGAMLAPFLLLEGVQ